MRGVAAGVSACVGCKGGDDVAINLRAFHFAQRLASTSSASASEKSSTAGVTLSCPATLEKVNASASGATCVRCSLEPAATKQSSTPASSTSMTSASSLMPRS